MAASRFVLQPGLRIDIRSYLLILRSDLSTSYLVIYVIIIHFLSVEPIYNIQSSSDATA